MVPPPSLQEKDEAFDTFKAFVVPSREFLGPALSIVKKKIEVEGGRKFKLVATAFRDICNKKEPGKVLKYFATGPQGTCQLCWLRSYISS